MFLNLIALALSLTARVSQFQRFRYPDWMHILQDLLDSHSDEMTEAEIRQLWGESYEKIDARTLSFRLLNSLKEFFRDKGLDLAPLLRSIF